MIINMSFNFFMKTNYAKLQKKWDIFSRHFRVIFITSGCGTFCVFSFLLMLSIFLTSAQAADPVAENSVKNEVCLQETHKCAAPFLKKGGFIHGPTKALGCTICHDSKKVSLSNAAGVRPDLNKVCLVCHDDLEYLLKKGTNAQTGLHSAIQKKGCVACHDPHQSEVKTFLKNANTTELCVECHAPMKQALQKGFHKTFYKEGCMSCHEPHQSKNQNLLKTPEIDLCLKCHASHKEGDSKAHVKLPENIPLIKIGSWRHGESSGKILRCSQCHAVHGSDQKAFLKTKYSSQTYQIFSDQTLMLCFKCHNSKLVTETKEGSKAVTKFRNGDVNLHHLHIKGTARKRSCGACHEVHGATQKMLVKTGFEIHGIKFPIKYEKNERGGNCTTACHQKYSYDREQPVLNLKNEVPAQDSN